MASYIKLDRKILKWEWYKDSKVKSLFAHLLLIASFEDCQWQSHDIKRGQVLTGRKELAEETGLTEKEIRTALKKLMSTGEILKEVFNKFSIITVCNYEKYQATFNGIDRASKNDDLNGSDLGTYKGEDIGQGPAKGQQTGQQMGQQKDEKRASKNDTANDLFSGSYEIENLDRGQLDFEKGPAKGPANGPLLKNIRSKEEYSKTNSNKLELVKAPAEPAPPPTVLKTENPNTTTPPAPPPARPPKPPPKNTLEEKQTQCLEREKIFKASLKPFIELYTIETLKEFFDYWSEPDIKSQTQMRFEKEKTWDLKRRLRRWTKDDKKSNNLPNNKNTTENETYLRERQKLIERSRANSD